MSESIGVNSGTEACDALAHEIDCLIHATCEKFRMSLPARSTECPNCGNRYSTQRSDTLSPTYAARMQRFDELSRQPWVTKYSHSGEVPGATYSFFSPSVCMLQSGVHPNVINLSNLQQSVCPECSHVKGEDMQRDEVLESQRGEKQAAQKLNDSQGCLLLIMAVLAFGGLLFA